MYTEYIRETSKPHMNTIYRIYISIHNRIKCCIYIHIINIIDKPEKE